LIRIFAVKFPAMILSFSSALPTAARPNPQVATATVRFCDGAGAAGTARRGLLRQLSTLATPPKSD
jgi:hypothetical protein